jgi:hypothetical protein
MRKRVIRMGERYLSLLAFAEFVDCCPNSAYKLLKEKRVRSYRIGNRWRVPISAAEAFVRGEGGGSESQSGSEPEAA